MRKKKNKTENIKGRKKAVNLKKIIVILEHGLKDQLLGAVVTILGLLGVTGCRGLGQTGSWESSILSRSCFDALVS